MQDFWKKVSIFGVGASFLGLLFVGSSGVGFGQDEDLIAKGKKIFEDKTFKCAICHGKDAKEGSKNGPALATGEYAEKILKEKDPGAKIEKQIMDGYKADQKKWKKDMPGLKGKIKPDEMKALKAYILSLLPKAGEKKEEGK